MYVYLITLYSMYMQIDPLINQFITEKNYGTLYIYTDAFEGLRRQSYPPYTWFIGL